MATVGYLLGSTLMVALDVRWNWLVVAVGVVVGFVLANAGLEFGASIEGMKVTESRM